MEHLPIKFLDPNTTPLRIPSHKELEAHLKKVPGKHREDVQNELRCMWAYYLRHGWFSFSYDRLDWMYGREGRRKITDILWKITIADENSQRWGKCIRREFFLRVNIRGDNDTADHRQRVVVPSRVNGSAYLVGNLPAESGVVLNMFGEPDGKLEVPADCLDWRMIPGAWLTKRRHMWTEWCEETGRTQNLDFDGQTDWGLAGLESLDKVTLPTTATTKHSQARIDTLTKKGVVRMVIRIRSRLYCALTGLAKPERRQMLIDGEVVGEVDMSATFTVLLTSLLHPAYQKRILDKVNAGEWYVQFEPVFAEYKARKTIELRVKGWTEERIAKRFQGGCKVEYQRQCNFWRDPTDRPLWDVLGRNHPRLQYLIGCMHAKYGVSKLYDILTKAEAGIFIDDALPQLHKEGVLAIPVHDALVVQERHLEHVRSVLERIAEEHLGFVPRFKITKRTVAYCLAQ